MSEKENQESFYIDNDGVSHKPNPKTIKLILDKSKAMKTLEEENADLKAKLTIIAEKEFNRRRDGLEAEAKKLGLSVDIENPSDLKSVEKIIQQNKGNKVKRNSREIPLSHATGFGSLDNEGKSVLDREYKNIPEMMADLDSEANKGNKEAQNTLTEIGRKELGELDKFEFEFAGKLTSDDPEERTKWTKKRKLGV